MSKLAQGARAGVLWTTGFQFFGDVLQFGVTLILARLLPPDAYGQFGLVTTVLGFLTILSFRAPLAYVLQVREDSDTLFQDQFTAGMVIQGAMCVAANVIALVVRHFDTYAAIAPMLHVMSVLFLLDLPSELRVKMLERQLEWKRLRLLHALGLALTAGLSIGLAMAGIGAYALLVPTFSVAIVFSADLFFGAGWRPTWSWNWERYRSASAFGASRMAAGSLATASQVVESSWLTRAIGFSGLGFVNRATGLAQLACQRVVFVLMAALYPVLTRIPPQTDAYRRAASLFLRATCWLVLPLGAILATIALPIIRFLYGDRWIEAVPLVPLATVVCTLFGIVQAGYTLLLAHQRQNRCLFADGWRLAGTLLALAFALPFGIKGYLAAMAVVHVVNTVLLMTWLHADSAVTGRAIVDAFVPPLVATGLALACCLGICLLNGWTLTTIVQGAAYAIAFCVIYLAALRLLFPGLVREVLGYLPGERRWNRLLLFPETA